MKKETLKDLAFYLSIAALWASAFILIPEFIGKNGFFGEFFATHTFVKMGLIWVGMAHLTICAMSICFHRAHTHQAVKLNRFLDASMQIFLWAVTSMSKLDWVSVHVYHHTHSDTVRDPHSPKHKGFWHVFLLGAVDYSKAKSWPEVLKIRERIPATPFERFIARHLFMAPIILSSALLILFGPIYGSILSVLNFAISPFFAVGGVNTIAHTFGYQNYDAKDDSRNIGFLFPLNWIIGGELDHNNHHKYPKSPTFAHRWFEFDIGWVYIRMMRMMGLAKVKGKVPVYKGETVSVETQTDVAFTS